MKNVCKVILLLLAFAPSLSHAMASGSVVFDPSNYAENVMTALQTAKQYSQSVQDYILQYKQYLVQLQNAKKMASGDLGLTDVQHQLQSYQNLYGSLQSFYGSLKTSNDLINKQFTQFSASGLTGEQYLKQQEQYASMSKGANQTGFQAAVRSMQDVQHQYALVKKYQTQIPNSPGLQSSMQTMNEQMNLIASQNAQLLQLKSASQIRHITAQNKSVAQDTAAAKTNKAIDDMANSLLKSTQAYAKKYGSQNGN